MTSTGSGKIWILVADWSRVKSSEPNAGDITRKIGPLYFNGQFRKYAEIVDHNLWYIIENPKNGRNKPQSHVVLAEGRQKKSPLYW